jgi:hypothetical protein
MLKSANNWYNTQFFAYVLTSLFFWLAYISPKRDVKNESAKIKCFKRLAVARILAKLNKMATLLYMVQSR